MLALQALHRWSSGAGRRENLPLKPRERYGLDVLRAVVILLLAFSWVRAADWVELKDGTRVEGQISQVTPDTIIIEVQTTPSIRDEQVIPRGEVARFQRAGLDDLAFADLAALSLPVTADSPAAHDALLERQVRPFMQNYAYSKHMPAVRRLAQEIETERARLAAGEVKIDGAWIAAADWTEQRAELGGRLQLSRMKNAADPVAALVAFEELEKNFSGSSAYPEAVELAQETIRSLRTAITRTRADLQRRERERAERLDLASADRRAVIERGIEQERAARAAQVARAKQAGSKWLPLVEDAKLLDDLAKLADTEFVRLEKIDVETMQSGASAARQAAQEIESGDLASAKESLGRAEKLWSKHVLLASLKESLKKAEAEAAQAAAAAAAEPKP